MKWLATALLVAGMAGGVAAQDLDYSLNSKQTQAVLNAGISYDLLRYPTNVSFDYPEGYLSFNIPLDLTTDKYDFSDKLKGSDERFTPTFGARQRLNYAFRVNIPMLKGVITYAQTENVNFDLNMNLGSTVSIDTTLSISKTTSDKANLKLAGAVNLPIRYEMGWRTQTFGYAYKPRPDMVFAINLHHHLFEANANGQPNINILGNVTINSELLKKELPINYSEEDVYGQVSGHYKGSAWSPAFGLKWWRFTVTSRIGVTTDVKGHFKMNWQVPFFINPHPKQFGIDNDKLVVTKLAKDTGEVNISKLLSDFNELEVNLTNAATDSYSLSTVTPAEFVIPSGQTITFEAWKKHLFLSYTFIHGGVHGDGAISGFHKNDTGEIDFDLGFNIQHVTTMNFVFEHAKFTLGAMLLDFYMDDTHNWISSSAGLEQLGGVPIPIVHMATNFGVSNARVLLELDLLPIPALKTGFIYYF
ncbi:MAG: hypothetical protein JNL74_02910 [Fibrobacteres bacterium]|nr:hypothetical protein [Fibrobacterota bacterium]